MIIPTNAIDLREQLQAEIDAVVSQHLAAGGQIERLSSTERAPYKTISHGRVISQRPNVRRQQEAQDRKISEYGKALAWAGMTVDQARKRISENMGITITGPRLEQLAAMAGYHYHDSGRGRP